MKDVLITIVGIQKDGCGEESRIELVTAGRSYRKNSVDYIAYRESEISGMEGSTTVLKLYRDHVSLVRMGSVEQKQDFVLGERTYSTYITSFGSIKMSVLTKELHRHEDNYTQTLKIVYELSINGQWQSDNTLSVSIREESKNGRQSTTAECN